MSPIALLLEGSVYPPQYRIVGEGAQQLVVAVAGLMNAADNGVDDAELGVGAEPLVGNAGAGGQAATGSGVLQSAGHRGAESDDTAALRHGLSYRAYRRLRNPVGLVERQPAVERRVAGRRDPGGVGQRGESDAPGPQAPEELPVEEKAGRGTARERSWA